MILPASIQGRWLANHEECLSTPMKACSGTRTALFGRQLFLAEDVRERGAQRTRLARLGISKIARILPATQRPAEGRSKLVLVLVQIGRGCWRGRRPESRRGGVD